jgi:hypothetical protein
MAPISTILAGNAQMAATMKVACKSETPLSLAKPAKPTWAVIRMRAGMLVMSHTPEKNHEARVLGYSSWWVGVPESAMSQR